MIATGALVAAFVAVGIRLPIAIAGGTLLLVAFGLVEGLTFPQLFLSNVNSYTLLAVPLYLLAGSVMTKAGLGERLFAFITSVIRGIPGSLGHATLGSTLFFAGMTGSSAADVAAVGSTALPTAERLGYRKDFIAGIVASGGTLGILVPPSLTMIIYGSITNTSIVDLFTAGIVPAVVLASLMFLVIAVRAHRGGAEVRGAHVEPPPLLRSARRAVLALLTPAIIAGGIYTGFVTPTEAGALAVVWAVIAGIVQRTLTVRKFWEACLSAARISAMLFLIIAGASVFGQVMTLEGVPQDLNDFIVDSFGGSRIAFLLFVNVLFLVMGAFLESFSIMLMMVPLLFPTAVALGIDPVHFAVIVTVNIEIGLLTPPYGTNLFTVSALSRLPVLTVARASAPYLLVMLGGLIAITYWPWLSLVLIH